MKIVNFGSVAPQNTGSICCHQGSGPSTPFGTIKVFRF